MNIPRFSLNYRTVTLTAVFLAFAWGLNVYNTMPRNEDPQYLIRIAVITTRWSGASAKKVEDLITSPIEKLIVAMDEVRRVWSESRIGFSIVYVELEDAVPTPDNVWNKLKDRLGKLQPTLPQGSEPPYVDDSDFATTTAMVMALYPLYSQKYSHEDLRKYAKDIQSELTPIEDVGKFQFLGVQPEVINLEVSAGVWSKLPLTTDTLRFTLQEKNILAPGGRLDTGLSQFNVNLSGEFSTTEQIEKVVLGSIDRRSPTYLRDLGIRVERGYPSPATYFCRYGKKDFVAEKALVIGLSMKKGGNIVILGKRVHEKLEEIRKKVLPPDIRIEMIADQPFQVENAISNFIDNLFYGVFVVLLFGFLMVGLRMSLIMAVSIPMVMITSIGIVRLFGVELEQVSIAGLMVALGMLVDNAIEVSENVHRRMCEGENPFDATWKGAQEISIPILSATLTTVAVFLPMVMMPGGEGEYIFSLPAVVATTLSVSWIIAMSGTTILCYWLLKPTAVQGGIIAFCIRCWIAMVAVGARLRSGQGGVFAFAKRLWSWVTGNLEAHGEHKKEGWAKNIYANALRTCLRRRYITLFVGFSFCIACFSLSSYIGSQFFPLAFRDQFIIDIWMPRKVPITRTDEVCREIEGFVRNLSVTTIDGQKVDRLKSFASFIGGGVPRFYITVDPEPIQQNLAQIIINVNDPNYVDSYITDLNALVKKRIAGGRIEIRKLNMGTRSGAPVAIRVIGKDVDEIRDYADNIKQHLYAQSSITNIYDDWGGKVFQIQVNVDSELANLAGVTNQDVARTMSSFLEGEYITTFREGDHNIPIFLRLPKEKRESLVSLYNLHIQGQNNQIPIDGIAGIDVVWADSNIARRGQEKTLTVYANIEDNALPNDVVQALLPYLNEFSAKLPTGYRLEVGGEWEDTKRSEKNFEEAFNISLIMIILILVSQYNGLIKPFMILLTLPLAFSGSFVGLFLTGWPLNFMAQLGLLSLAGIVLNGAIVLIEFVEKQIKTGMPLEDAVVKGSCMRTVPILLTTLTTAGGLLPLAFWGGPMWVPMANVIIFGLMTATLLTLIFVPTVYYVLCKDFKIQMVEPDSIEAHSADDDIDPQLELIDD